MRGRVGCVFAKNVLFDSRNEKCKLNLLSQFPVNVDSSVLVLFSLIASRWLLLLILFD